MRELSDKDHALRRLGYERGYAAGYRAAQAAMPPRDPTQAMIDAGEKRRREIAGRGLCIGTIWRAMYAAWTQDQTSGGTHQRPEEANASKPDSRPGSLDPIADLCARLRDEYEGCPSPVTTARVATLREAADAVERLARERDEARDGWRMANGVADLAMKHRDSAEAERERLARERDDIREMLQNTNRDAARLANIAYKYKWQVRDTCTRAERAEAERDALREVVRAADAMADAYYPDPFHHAPPLTVDAYNAARAKVNP